MSCICRKEPATVALVTAKKIGLGEKCWVKVVDNLPRWGEKTPLRAFREASGLVRS